MFAFIVYLLAIKILENRCDNVVNMRLFTTLLFSLFVCAISRSVKPKLCIHCQYFIPKKGHFDAPKCKALPFENVLELIDGNSIEMQYFSCSVARSYTHLCGKNGSKYRKKYQRRTK